MPDVFQLFAVVDMSFACVLHNVICLRVAYCHVIMCISFCIRVRLMHPSIFPVVRFAIRRSYALRHSPSVSRCERVLNVLEMDRVLPSGLGLLPVDRLSCFVSFGLRLILQRLTEGPKRPHVCCSPTPLQSGPITLPNPFHVLRRRITIAWPKTAHHLDTSTSSYL